MQKENILSFSQLCKKADTMLANGSKRSATITKRNCKQLLKHSPPKGLTTDFLLHCQYRTFPNDQPNFLNMLILKMGATITKISPSPQQYPGIPVAGNNASAVQGRFSSPFHSNLTLTGITGSGCLVNTILPSRNGGTML